LPPMYRPPLGDPPRFEGVRCSSLTTWPFSRPSHPKRAGSSCGGRGESPASRVPFRLSYAFAFVFNWPFVAFFLLVASTALAIAQSGVGSPVMWHTLAVGP